MKRTIPIAIAAMLSLASLCQAQTELVVWHAYRGEEKAAFEKVVAQYNAPGVKVTTLAVPYDAYADKITAAVPRGKGPDVFIFAQDRLGGWIAADNTIEPLDFFLDDEITKRYLPTTLEAMTYQGQIWGLPLNYKCIALIYNTALVKEPPKTSGELVKVAKSLTDTASGRFGVAYWFSDFYYHAALMNGFGGGVFGPAGEPTLNRPENIASLELLMKWYDVDKFLPAEPSTALITSLFNGGKAAMVLSGPWFLGEVSKDVKFAIAPLPTLDEAGGKPMKPWMTVEGVYIASPSKSKDAAYDFLTYLTDVPAGLVMSLEGRQTPANLGVYKDSRVAADPVLQAFRKQVEVAVPMPNRPEMTMVWSPATTAMNAITRKTATPKAAMEQAQAEVVDRISKLRK